MPDPTDDDITALRRDGDLSQYLRGLIRPTRTTVATADDRAFGPRHQPGAWPAGTHPPTSAICHPDCGCALTKPPTT
ncbi:hypothetical protein VSR01_10655 [Actinacidiphila sp. DG2A-62]|uniref:hypothetical protein n=1 Tax=Actinacidiphila sp. DG2A-62 TaxID=3108821 RepID=UPI002DB8CC15|nr:hypothetical protein [Actinacidiphila sp. DG2A-62]MEC3993978.1 hypothetical protein [Actinacidiphila sp. DG2A-62]